MVSKLIHTLPPISHTKVREAEFFNIVFEGDTLFAGLRLLNESLYALEAFA